jgi:hypothetical protein
MFGKVKKILGIEGVKLELILPPKISKDVGLVSGLIKLTSLSDDNTLEAIHVVMIEKYSRGRGNNQLINEYTMGELHKKENISISKNDIIEIPFELEFLFARSEMDKLEESNFLAGGLVKLAKKIRGVKSEFSIRAEAHIKGTTLHPFDVKPVILE